MRERVLLPLILLVLALGLVYIAYDEAGDGRTRLIAGIVFAISAAAATLQQVASARAGTLIVRRAAEREARQAANRRAAPFWVIGAVAVTAIAGGLVADNVKAVVTAGLAGYIWAITPVLLYIAFVIRPDEHVGEDL